MKLTHVFVPGWHRSVWLRRAIVGALVCAAGVSALVQHDPEVITVGRNLSAGDTISEGDLRLTRIPGDLIPDGRITDPAEAIGQIAVVDLARGEILMSSNMTGEGVTPPGTTSVPLRLSDPAVAELLKNGDSVAIVSGDGSIVCDHATVILPREDTVLVSLPNDLAPLVAAAAINGPITVVVRSATSSAQNSEAGIAPTNTP